MHSSFRRTILCLAANISVISSGMGLGYPSISNDQLLKILTPNQVSWFASIAAITCPVGGLISGYFCDKFGRKSTLIFNDIIALISFLIIGLAIEDLHFLQLMIARIIIGFNIGMSTTPAVMYTAEICSPEIRGRLSMLSSPFFTAFGMLVIYFLGAVVAKNHQTASLHAAGISLITLILCLPIPESPVYYVNKNQIENARKSLSRVFSIPLSDPQITEELQMLEKNKSTKSRWQFKEFKEPRLYKPFIMMLTFFTIQQFSGIFTIFIFAAQFSIQVGVVIDPLLSAVIIGLTRVLVVLAFAFLSDKAGRRPLSIFSCSGMLLGMLGLVGCGIFSESLKNSIIFWLPTVFLYFFIFFGTFGVLALPFAMLGEVYPQKSRGLATGLTIAFAYCLSFINVKTFTICFDTFGSTIMFAFYAFIAFIGVLFSIFFLVETKGKTLQEIELNFISKRTVKCET